VVSVTRGSPRRECDAGATLDRQCYRDGLIWGTYDARGALKKAAREAGCFTDREIQHLSMHDLRHGAIAKLASASPNLPGIAHLAGHVRVNTTTQYVHSTRDQTRAVLDARPRIIPVPDSELKELTTPIEQLNA
jgi:integrase